MIVIARVPNISSQGQDQGGNVQCTAFHVGKCVVNLILLSLLLQDRGHNYDGKEMYKFLQLYVHFSKSHLLFEKECDILEVF